MRAQLVEKTARLEALETALSAAREVRSDAEVQYDQALAEFTSLDLAVAQRRETIAALVRRLPPDERTVHDQAAEVSSLRGRLERLRLEHVQLGRRTTHTQVAERGRDPQRREDARFVDLLEIATPTAAIRSVLVRFADPARLNRLIMAATDRHPLIGRHEVC